MRLAGIEPTTLGLGIPRSILLSYSRTEVYFIKIGSLVNIDQNVIILPGGKDAALRIHL